ncbi:hypothetical protein [Sulfurospirillum arcachonense]|nr:hypothetical protein [Sulfurospirillum arcachonense]
MKKLLLIIGLIYALMLSGCADKNPTNPAYKNFKKSPCACMEQGEMKNV